MEKIITKVLMVATILAVLIGVVVLVNTVQAPKGIEIKDETGKVVGISSPDINSPYFSYGDVKKWGSKTDSLTQATTTVCALQAPSATSTLDLGSGIRLAISSTTASSVKIAKSNVPYDVSSTFLAGANVAANAQATVVASTSLDAFVFSPNQYMIVQMAGGTGTFSPSGACQATWTQI